ncbi:MAG: Glycosyl transferase, group 1 [Microgenomates group bacterium Gr01-1014_7]|nr:MAG: Glycosyl transferase, group 1 [Microgenomates group bacterium Gr01-1014_7]
MKIGINILPLETAHKSRGIGYYTKNLIDILEKDNEVEIIKFRNQDELKNVDLVHYPWFDLFFHTLPIKKNFPTVVTIHDVIPLIFSDYYPVGIKGKFNHFLQKIALSNCAVMTDSHVSKLDIIKHLKIDSSKITAVYLSADWQFKVLPDRDLIYIKRKYQLPDQYILYVGDANWTKNLPFLIDGFRKLLEYKELENLKLILVGGVFLKNVENIDHPELESLKLVNKLIKEYSLEQKIIKPGNLEDKELIAFYNLATVYVQPSLYEGFGMPILQSFACGTPVISSNRGSLKEVGGDAAVYFDPTNVSQFVKIARELLYDKSLQSKLSRLGLKQAARFSWIKFAEEIKKVYLKVIK